jgi:hypothetical protein
MMLPFFKKAAVANKNIAGGNLTLARSIGLEASP